MFYRVDSTQALRRHLAKIQKGDDLNVKIGPLDVAKVNGNGHYVSIAVSSVDSTEHYNVGEMRHVTGRTVIDGEICDVKLRSYQNYSHAILLEVMS